MKVTLLCSFLVARAMTVEAEKIKCKICGLEVHPHRYHRHVMALHSE